MIIDQWNPSRKQYRLETFCYCPKSCPFYRPGPARKVPGRKGMSYTEEDWVDENANSHRGLDDSGPEGYSGYGAVGFRRLTPETFHPGK